MLVAGQPRAEKEFGDCHEVEVGWLNGCRRVEGKVVGLKEKM